VLCDNSGGAVSGDLPDHLNRQNYTPLDANLIAAILPASLKLKFEMVQYFSSVQLVFFRQLDRHFV
jgi:hypothetical protein